ncbi:hypothetical protein SAMN04487948_12710 [Halogranum amylolyticum]|uniref:20S proteasome, alpha and beta subunits n=2 Tax=Halogranum amylolyticum TaxID=660520 RepID=A0A1H8WC64_9EURY|nr:hypothetical protein SAMN04487948_12710 [Halogranum amylolyticum]
MVTDTEIPIEFESSRPKFSGYGNEDVQVLFSSAGDALIPDRIEKHLKTNQEDLRSVQHAATVVRDKYVRIKQEKFEDAILRPRGISLSQFYREGLHNSGRGKEWDRLFSQHSLNLDIMITGVGPSGARTFRVSDSDEIGGLVESFDGLGFDAVGTGASLARDTLTGRYSEGLQISEALYVVYAALRNASQAPGVGREFDIAKIHTGSSAAESGGLRSTRISDETLAKLEKVYDENEIDVSAPAELNERIDLE